MTVQTTAQPIARTRAIEDAMASIAVSAMEGGIYHWARLVDYQWHHAELAPEVWGCGPAPLGGRNAAGRVQVIDTLDEHLIDLDLVERGLATTDDPQFDCADRVKHAAHCARRGVILAGLDAHCADVIVQAGLFGNVRYA